MVSVEATGDGQHRDLGKRAVCNDPDATLDDFRKAVTTLEDTERIARRVFGGEHPLTTEIEKNLQFVRAALRAREDTQP